ncbi:MAG: PEP/pyruvate-binding domain-containing protein [Bariatricus sp.]
MIKHEKVSTGMPGLDAAIDMLRMGDNVVWQIDRIEDYVRIVQPYVRQAQQDGRRLVYIRFGKHQEVVRDEEIEAYRVDAEMGFESFAMEIHHLIQKNGKEVFYVFDCLTDLLESWCSDLMIWNFFKVTCPYLYDMDTVAYFAVKRGRHTCYTIAGIRQTTQCLLDVYNIEKSCYIHPLKATGRYSPTMFFPHRIADGKAVSITASTETAELFAGVRLDDEVVDYWDHMIRHAKRMMEEPEELQEEMKNRLIHIALEKNPRMEALCRKHFKLEDLVRIISREIGTGYIGGKSVGMLLARKIITNAGGKDADLKNYIAAEDSFFIGTDTFYTYIVQNGWWNLRARQRTEEEYFTLAEDLREKLMSGTFPERIEYEFMHMLEYFGQAPIIVRSSSLQEDHFGNAFAGKYDSVFCVNQGTPEERLEAFEQAVRTVYASTMNPDALKYRKQRGLALEDEQMAILVQRVSGDYYGKYFFPHAAGVGNSSNLYVWSQDMDMDAGMLRLVFGLGTRAVDRVIGDYVRIVPLDQPNRMPLLALDDERKFSQHKADVLNLVENELQEIEIDLLLQEDIRVSKALFVVQDYDEARRLRELGYTKRPIPYTVNFKRMLSQTDFPRVMRRILKLLEREYDYPVDTEFTVNYTTDTEFKINLVQCRPLQTKGLGKTVDFPEKYNNEDCLYYSKGNFMGGNVQLQIDYTVFVDIKPYLKLPEQEKYQVARCVGMINERLKEKSVLLVGPGRWGTTTPALGVPVHFTEISHMAAICEVSYPNEGLMPELSYGSHFFQDMVESGIFYTALFQGREQVFFQERLLKGSNLLEEFLPEAHSLKEIIYLKKCERMYIYSDIERQEVICLESGVQTN